MKETQLVQIYLIHAKLNFKMYGLLREDDYISSYVCGSINHKETEIEYRQSHDFSTLFLFHDKSVELLDTVPEDEVLSFLKLHSMLTKGTL